MAVRHHGVRGRLCLGLCIRQIASWRQHLCRTHVVEGRLLGRANLTLCNVFARDLRAWRSCRDVLDERIGLEYEAHSAESKMLKR